jgi:hypothetical protein
MKPVPGVLATATSELGARNRLNPVAGAPAERRVTLWSLMYALGRR